MHSIVFQPDLEEKSRRNWPGTFRKRWERASASATATATSITLTIFCPETWIISWSNEYTALLGIWARPIHGLRLNFDLEHTNYDNVFVRMAPRKEARYRFQTTYTPRPWATVGGSINILQDSNADASTQFRWATTKTTD